MSLSYLVRNKSERHASERFRELLMGNDQILKIPGVHDAMASLLATKEGFQAIYLSGAAFSASLGMPDLGIITLTELATRTREITRATDLPLLVDIDTGFGSVLHVNRTIQELFDAGAAGVQMEDQDLPKKCGHLNGKKLVSTKEMVQKIIAARTANEKMVIVARTDATSVEGFDEAVKRAKAYVDAGADVIFPEALRTEKEFRTFAEAINAPLLANMTEFGKTPYFTAEQFHKWGYKMVIYPVTSLRVTAKAIVLAYKLIQEKGTQKEALDSMQTRAELYELIRYADYEQLDDNIAKTILE